MMMFLVWTNELIVDNVLPYVTTSIAIAGVWFGIAQLRSANRTKRAEMIKDLVEKLRSDDDLCKAMRIIDYKDNWYNAKFHNKKNSPELVIDKLFATLSYICYLHKTNNIKDKELGIFEYYIHRVFQSEASIEYLWNIYHFSHNNKIKCSFEYLIHYGLDKKLIDNTFKSKDCKRYKKYLNS